MAHKLSSFFYLDGVCPRFTFPSFFALLSILLGVVSPASAQTSPPQRIYASQPLTTTTSIISGFSKNSQTGALTLIPGSPFPERLEGGLMAIDGQGKFLFVLNPTSDNISMFQIDQVSGALSEVMGSPFSVAALSSPFAPPNPPPPTGLISIVTEQSGKFVFVGYRYAFGTTTTAHQSAVVSLAIDTSGSSPILLPVTSIFPVGAPIKLFTDSNGLHLYVGMGFAWDGSVMASGPEVYSIDGAGNLSYQSTAPNIEAHGADFAIDPQDRFIFAVGGTTPGHIGTCIISPVDGTVSACGNVVSLLPDDNGGGLLVERSGNFLYIPDSTQSVRVFSIDQTTGNTTQVGSSTKVFSSTGGFVADLMGPYVYSADGSANGVHAYLVDQQTGNLTEIPESPFSPGAASANSCCQGLVISGNLVQPNSGPGAAISPSTAATFNAIVGINSATQVFSIVNTGNQQLSFSSLSIAGTNAANFSQTNTCMAILDPGAHCSVSITFTPASVGIVTASLQVTDNAPDSPQALALTGNGIAPAPAVTFSPSTGPSFPTTTEGTSSAPQTLTVNSAGNIPLHVSSISLGGPNPSDFSFTNNCTSPVAPAASCTISLVFSPIASGQRTANLLIADDVAGSPQTIALSATANLAATGGPAPNGSTTTSVSAGQPAQYHLQFTPGAGFSGSVSLTCSGAPLGAVCQVPASIPLANGVTAPFTVTVTTSGPAVVLPSTPLRIRAIPAAPVLPVLAFALLLLIYGKKFRALECIPGSHRSALRGVLAAATFCMVLGAAGCGGGSVSVTPPPIITPTGTSTITITPSAMSSSGQPLQLQPIQLTLIVR